MSYLVAFILGGLVVFVVYHFNLQPKLRAERDKAVAELKSKFGGG